jgi:YcxB-like protein
MILHFQFTLDDYRNAFRAHYQKGASALTRWTMKLILVIGVIFFLFGILLLLTGQRAPNVVLYPLLLGAFWTWIGLGKTYQLAAKKQFTKNPVLREPRSIELNDEGVTTDAGIASSQVSWKAYLRYVESKDTFLLYTNPACFIIVPKRVLQPEQVNELRQLFQAHIGKEAAVAVA